MNELINDQDFNFGIVVHWLEQIENLSKYCGDAYGGPEGTMYAIWRVPITNAEKKHRRWFKASDRMSEAYQLCRSGRLRASVPAPEAYSERTMAKLKLAGEYWLAMLHRSSGRRFFVTEGGLLGVGPSSTSKGDAIAIIAGHYCPIILRPKDKHYYQWLGESYVDGIMNGEVGECADESLLEVFTII
jgi:hypothetical protein